MKSDVVNEVTKKEETIKLDVTYNPAKNDSSLDDILKDVNLGSDPVSEPFEFNKEDTLPKASINTNDDSFFKNLDNSDIFSDSKEKKESIFTMEQTKLKVLKIFKKKSLNYYVN